MISFKMVDARCWHREYLVSSKQSQIAHNNIACLVVIPWKIQKTTHSWRKRHSYLSFWVGHHQKFSVSSQYCESGLNSVIPGSLFLWISFCDIKITNGNAIFNITCSQFYRKWCNKTWAKAVYFQSLLLSRIKHKLNKMKLSFTNLDRIYVDLCLFYIQNDLKKWIFAGFSFF